MEDLVQLLMLTQAQLKNEVYAFLKEHNMNPVYADGYVYAKGDIPILLVAHLDTIYIKPPRKIHYNIENDKLFAVDSGTGGDDRCGVYAILKILQELKPHVLFTEDEEKGAIGAMKATYFLPKPNVKYIIELDRSGNNDAVFYYCDNEEFKKYIESFGFVTQKGIFSDICVLAENWDVAAVNLSSAYYEEHSCCEYIKFKELESIIKRVKNMINNHMNAKYYEFTHLYFKNVDFKKNTERKLSR